jgi:hypothetical protein
VGEYTTLGEDAKRYTVSITTHAVTAYLPAFKVVQQCCKQPNRLVEHGRACANASCDGAARRLEGHRMLAHTASS